MNLYYDNLKYAHIEEKFDISIEEEKELWEKFYLNKFIYIPKFCSK